MPSSDEQRDEKRKTRTDVETKQVIVARNYRSDPHAEEKAIRTLLAGESECKGEERHDS